MNDRNPIVATDGRYDYRIVELIGPEPGGELYAAEASGRDGAEPVSIRTFNDRELVDVRFRDRLVEAVKLHRQIKHSAILPIRSFIELHHAPAVVFEAMHGRRLSVLLRDGPLPVRAAAAMGEQLASGLHALHAAGAGGVRPMGRTHQDLHPDTILVTHDGFARMLEVGTARARIALDRPDVSGQAPVPAYTSPERRAGKDRPEADVYALGIVLLEALSGLTPEPMSDDPAEHSREVSQFVAAVPTAPASVRSLIQEMLAFDVNARPSAREVGRRLRALVPDLEGPWLSAWSGERIPAPAPVRPTPSPIYHQEEEEERSEANSAKAPKAAPVEALRPLKRSKTPSEKRRAAVMTIGSIVIAAVLAVFVGVLLYQPEWVTRWWVDNHGDMDLEDVPTDLPGPPDGAEPSESTTTKVTVDPNAAPAAAPDAPGAGGSVTVVSVEGDLGEPGGGATAGPPLGDVAAAPGEPIEIAVVVKPSSKPGAAPAAAPVPAGSPAVLSLATNPDQQPARITRRKLKKRLPTVTADAPFGEDYEEAADDAPRVALEVIAPLAGDVRVVCAGGVGGSGEGAVRLSEVPTGRCDVRAVLGGAPALGTFQLDGDRRVECRVEFADHLRCW